MSLRERIFTEGMKASQHPLVAKLIQDPRFMQLIVLAMSVPGRVSTFTAEQKERFARELGLVTEDEAKDLKRRIAALEDDVRRLERER
jgi:hypothetical protein